MDETIQTPISIEPVKTKPNFLTLILSTLLFIFIISTGFFTYQTIQLQKQIILLQTDLFPIPTPSTMPALNKCVDKSFLNCAEEAELSFECSDEYQSWAQVNCPGWWGDKIYCNDPRPEMCTFECTYPPPYLCGSDGNSYCTVCQACSNQDVIWYELKTSSCENLEQTPSSNDPDFSMGWYYGTKDQKTPNTPTDWIYSEGGRDSCWHKPNIQCSFLPD